MKSCLRLLFVVSAVLSLAGCDKPTPPAAVTPVAAETDNQLAEARDALQRQALEIETKTALMDKQLAEMEQSLKDRENVELRGSLDALKLQNDELRVQADVARRQSDAIAQSISATPLPNVALQAGTQPDYSLFYESLAPYGSWFEVNGYGYCWQPTLAVEGWLPYLDGCWVWSSYGWAWQTNEPFGWATYHYGRWVNLSNYGWVWVPGGEWAPAWVAWRQSRDCVGWAPLPPEPGVCSGVYRDCDSRYGLGPTSYIFINTNQFVSSSYINVYAPVTRQTTIFQRSVNVTQIVPCHGNGHAFVQQGGPPRVQMEQACGLPVPQRQVQTLHADQMSAQHSHGRMEGAGPVAMVELPAVAPGARTLRPEIKEHTQRPAPMRGFEGVPQQAVTEMRENRARGHSVPQQPAAAEQMSAHAAAEAEQARLNAAAMQQRQQEMNERAQAEKRVAEQAAVTAEAERSRMQAAAAQQQQEEFTAHQQRMAAERAAVETEKTRQPAAVQQQQQLLAAQQQRATAEHQTAERAAEEAGRARQQTEAAAMQRQQEEATRRAAEEQQMRVRQEKERHEQEMAQRQAEEQGRRQREAEMQHVQENAQRQAEEQSRRAAEEQARAQHEAAQRAQETAQRQAEEGARRAQENAHHQAEEHARHAQEEAHRAAAETARNQPQPAPH